MYDHVINGVTYTLTSYMQSLVTLCQRIEYGYDHTDMENLSNIKCEDIEIKPEENYSDTNLQNLKDEPVDCTGTSLLTNYLNMKDEIKDICDDAARDSFSHIKFEDIESKSQKDYSDSPLQNLKMESANCTNECRSEYVKTTNTFVLKLKGKRYDAKDKHRLLKHSVFENETYKCNSCDYETNQKKNLRHHRLKHVPEEQMFKCDSFDYKTAYKRHFTQHQQKHKDIPEEQMFKCDSCGYKTIHKYNFKNHQLIHKDIPEEQVFKCDSCDYITVYKSYFTQHQLRHIPKEQMFKCGLCDYNTTYKRNFVLHQL